MASRSESLLDQPAAILATNSKMGNIFLHTLQTIDLLREDWGRIRVELWKYESIEAFVLVARRWAHWNFIHVFIVRQSISQDRGVSHVAGFACLQALAHEL
jgi:hypothetical protein